MRNNVCPNLLLVNFKYFCLMIMKKRDVRDKPDNGIACLYRGYDNFSFILFSTYSVGQLLLCIFVLGNPKIFLLMKT